MKFYADPDIILWGSVEKVANNDLARIVGLVPIVGYLILFNDEIARIAPFETLAGLEPGDASPFLISSLAKMRLVFFGSIFVMIANLIFKFFRPKVLEFI